MDELTIGDKIYISSKQAAKITGYAKDYVGQLCREGRVEARLVGRNWYVLESSIREHRFGKEAAEAPQSPSEASAELTSTWEAPRYAPEPQAPDLPPISVREYAPIPAAPVQVISDMQEAWKEWYEARGREVPEPAAQAAEAPMPAYVPASASETSAEDTGAPEASDIPNIYAIPEESAPDLSHEDALEDAEAEEGEIVHAIPLERTREERPMPVSAPLNLRAVREVPRTPLIPAMERVQSSASVIDLTRPAERRDTRWKGSHAPDRAVEERGRKERAQERVRTPLTVNAGLIAIAGIAATIALVGSGIVDAGLAGAGAGGLQESLINLVQGERVYVKQAN